jgi:1-acyl-sn-glycerol-3-phosphate acyltransferase
MGHECTKKVCSYSHTPYVQLGFSLGLLIRSSIRLRIHFVGKSSLFRLPFGGLFRRMGGYPVDRSKSHNYVDAVASIFKEKEEFRLTIAPEGTRKKVDRLKSGFYYIAQKSRRTHYFSRL